MPSPEIRFLIEARRAAASGEARQLRLRSRLTLQEVGGECHVASPTVSRWENGQRVPRGEAAIRYGKLLAVLRQRQEVA